MREQTFKMVRVVTTGTALGLVLCVGGREQAWSQIGSGVQQPQFPGQPGQSGRNKGGMQPPGMGTDTDDMTVKLQEQQSKTRNSERQKRLEVDTQKLLALATELKEQVDKTDKNILSVDVIKKADEIERLAKSVKERMKG
ncbi:hypothetical protein [Granulicella sp. dw_53]|uniref:hypothetical protein n=1 Tax=Granulicella sp. dw_53 TaxID=2719792 RepID=UPI001BD20045|nr:hypothetical protein [Granulicella sp. dw_53]